MDLEVSDEELSSAYNLYLENLPQPEKRISHIMLIERIMKVKKHFLPERQKLKMF